jgi:regulator of sigma E protease
VPLLLGDLLASASLLLAAGNPLRGIVGVVLGVGALIFFHEMGHFLAAKWAGVRVDVFSLGMGPRLFGFQRGDTDYRVSLLPIGGYVSMLGQVDGDPNQPPSQRDDDFRNKSIFKRFVIMVAGVVMNIVLAALLFVAIYGIGHEVVAPEVGRIRPGTAASRADLKPGDIVIGVGDDEVTSFLDLAGLIAINGEDEVALRVRRGGREFETKVSPIRGDETYAKLGVSTRDVIHEVPKGSLFAAGGVQSRVGDQWDRIVNVSPVDSRCPVDLEMSSRQVERLLKSNSGPLVYVFERARYDAAGTTCLERSTFETTVTLPRKVKRGLGLAIPDQVWIRGITKDSAAEKAGIKEGDRLVSLDGLNVTYSGLADQIKRVAARASEEGRKVRALLERDGSEISLEVLLEPRAPKVLAKALEGVTEAKERLEIRRAASWLLGVNYSDDVVSEASFLTPAEDGQEKIQLQPGDRLTAFWDDEGFLTWGKKHERVTSTELTALFSNGGPPRIKIEWLPKGSSEKKTAVVKPVDLTGETYPDWKGQLLFGSRMALIKRGPLGALSMGIQRTGVETRRLINTLGAFMSGSVSTKELGGPIQIVNLTYKASQEPITRLLYLLAILSVNLAVINLLPIPVLDGGHLFFLIVEKLKGQPVSAKVMINAQWFGLFCILGLLALVFFNDIRRVLFE